MTKEKFIEKCKKTHEVEYLYDKIPESFNTKEKPYFEIGCPICNEYWKVRYDQFQKGSNCPNCSKSGRKVKEENFETSSITRQLKLKATDGKYRMTDV